MNSIAGALPMDDAWEEAGASELAEDDDEYRKPDKAAWNRDVIEKTLKHLGHDILVWLKEERPDAYLYHVQADDEHVADKIRTMDAELELVLTVQVSFAAVADRPNAVCVIVPKVE